MDDAARADIDAMVGKAKTRCEEVRAQRGLFVPRQKSIVSLKSAAERTPSRRGPNMMLSSRKHVGLSVSLRDLWPCC